MKQLKIISIAGFVAIATLVAGPSVAAEDRVFRASPEAVKFIESFAPLPFHEEAIKKLKAFCRERGGEEKETRKDVSEGFSAEIDCWKEGVVVFSISLAGNEKADELKFTIAGAIKNNMDDQVDRGVATGVMAPEIARELKAKYGKRFE